MKRILFLLTAALFAAMFTKNARAQTATADWLRQGATAGRPMAKEGEKVWVLVNHAKADKRQQFEQFVQDVCWPMATKLSTEDQRLFRQTRVLHPTGVEADGTYSYLFIMDPVVENANYDIAYLLRKMYGEQKGAEYNRLFEATAARDQTQYLVVQPRY